MIELPRILLETELPMAATSWSVLVVSVLITAAWLVYVYR